MMKWLREHNKQIMAAVVLLAMFSFVGGSALTSIWQTDASDIDVMRSNNDVLTLADLNTAQAQTEVLSSLFLDWTNGMGEGFTARHWLLLAHEAEKAGIVASDKDVQQFLESREPILQQMNGSSLSDIRKRFGISAAELRSAVARQLAIGQNFERIRVAGRPSEPQVQHYARATEDKIEAAVVTLNAQNFVDPAEPLSDADVQAQFEKYRNVLLSESEEGFGYKYPRRVRLQYVSAPFSKIESQLSVSLDEIKNHWKANESRYMKTIYVDEPVPTTSPATQPSAEPEMRKVPRQVPKTFSESREEIARELRKNKAAKIARQAMQRLAEDLQRPWHEVKSDSESGFKPAPDAVKDPAYLSSAATQVASKFGITLDYQETGLLTAEDIESDFVLRDAETPGDEGDALRISEFAFRTPGFFKSQGEADSRLRLQLYQPPVVPMTVNSKGGYEFRNNQLVPKKGEPSNLILFRVIETRDSEAPATLEEVRTKVERDLRLVNAYNRIEPIAKELTAVAARVGLENALTYFEDLRTNRGVRAAMPTGAFSRMQRITDPEEQRERLKHNRSLLDYSNVPGIGRSEAFIKAAFEMTEPGWSLGDMDVPQTAAVEASTTQPAAVPAPKVRFVALPALKRWVVLELRKTIPLDTDSYATAKRTTVYQTLTNDRSMAARLAWFDPKIVEERCQYEDLDPNAEARSRYSVAPPEPPPFMY